MFIKEDMERYKYYSGRVVEICDSTIWKQSLNYFPKFPSHVFLAYFLSHS